jgi:hypothetical protein
MSINLPLFETTLEFNVPIVFFDGFDTSENTHVKDSLFFGKFYLYEGIAFKLDRLMHKILGRKAGNESLVGEEYKIMEKVAKSIVNDITEREMLDLASLSLSYLNAGEYFISFLKKCPVKKRRGVGRNIAVPYTHFATNLYAKRSRKYAKPSRDFLMRTRRNLADVTIVWVLFI